MKFGPVYFFPVFLALMTQIFLSYARTGSTIVPPTKTYLLLLSSHNEVRPIPLPIFGGSYPYTPGKLLHPFFLHLFFFLNTYFLTRLQYL